MVFVVVEKLSITCCGKIMKCCCLDEFRGFLLVWHRKEFFLMGDFVWSIFQKGDSV